MFKFIDGWFPVWRAVLAILRQRVAAAELKLKQTKAAMQEEHDADVARLVAGLEIAKERALRDEVAQIFRGV